MKIFHDTDDPTLEGGRYKVVGMGIVQVESDELIFYGKSEKYEIGLDRQHLENFLNLYRNEIDSENKKSIVLQDSGSDIEL